MPGSATRQTLIAEALNDGGCLTTAALVSRTGLKNRVVAEACCKLVYRGWIVRRERGCFELSDNGKKAVAAGETITSGPIGQLSQKTPRRPRRRTVRDKIWTTIVTLKKFRLADLETYAGSSVSNALHYVHALEKAGYLIRMRPEPGTALTSPGFVRWLLVRATGPEAPVHRRKRREVYDRNTGETHPIERLPE